MFKTTNMKFGSFSSNNSNDISSAKTSTTANSTSKTSSSKDTNKITSNDFVPKRFGLKFDPPAISIHSFLLLTIVLEYLVPSSGKLYHHKMKLPKLRSDSDVPETIEYLKNRHFQYFVNNKISDLQLKNLIDKLKKKLDNEEKPSSGQAFLTGVGLNIGSSTTNKSVNKLGPLSSLTNKKLDSDDNDENKKSNAISKPLQSTNKANSSLPTKKEESKPAAKSNDFWDFEEIDLPDGTSNKVDYNTTNLNKLSKAEIDKHKKNMDVLFNKNKKDVQDPDFVYDVQEEFQPHEDNEWDEDLDY